MLGTLSQSQTPLLRMQVEAKSSQTMGVVLTMCLKVLQQATPCKGQSAKRQPAGIEQNLKLRQPSPPSWCQEPDLSVLKVLRSGVFREPHICVFWFTHVYTLSLTSMLLMISLLHPCSHCYDFVTAACSLLGCVLSTKESSYRTAERGTPSVKPRLPLSYSQNGWLKRTKCARAWEVRIQRPIVGSTCSAINRCLGHAWPVWCTKLFYWFYSTYLTLMCNGFNGFSTFSGIQPRLLSADALQLCCSFCRCWIAMVVVAAVGGVGVGVGSCWLLFVGCWLLVVWYLLMFVHACCNLL